MLFRRALFSNCLFCPNLVRSFYVQVVCFPQTSSLWFLYLNALFLTCALVHCMFRQALLHSDYPFRLILSIRNPRHLTPLMWNCRTSLCLYHYLALEVSNVHSLVTFLWSLFALWAYVCKMWTIWSILSGRWFLLVLKIVAALLLTLRNWFLRGIKQANLGSVT